MKRYLHFLRTEYKRAAVLLPAILIKAVIVALAAGMIAFCVQKMLSDEQEQGLVQVGLTAPEDRLTNLAVSYIENLESVKSWCRLISVEQAEGERMVEEGELAALLVLPEHVVEGILTGSNEPARLYVSEDAAALGQVFEELANAGVGMLRTAQAEIYATHDLMLNMHAGQEGTAATQAETDTLQKSLTSMYEEIDAFNLGLVLNRERYFQEKSLSVTGGQSIALYYGSAFFTVYLLLAGLFFGRYSKRSVVEQKMAAKRLGIPVGAQMASRILVSMGLLCVVMLPLALLWLSEEMRRILPVVITGKGLLLLTLALCCAAALLQFLYQLADDRRTAVLLVGITAVILGYASGCFLPTALLPQVVERIAAVLPTTYIKSAFTVLFSGKVSGFAGTAAALCVWILALWGAGRLAVWFAEWREGRITKDEGEETIFKNGENSGRMQVLSLMASAGYADRKNMK
ncbi:MAG: ABC transporter permease, partial [Lachnospiraceae bacterium]